MNDPATWRPTPRLRWVARVLSELDVESGKQFVRRGQVLQQWHGPELPAYMVDDRVGEWRDVVTTGDAP